MQIPGKQSNVPARYWSWYLLNLAENSLYICWLLLANAHSTNNRVQYPSLQCRYSLNGGHSRKRANIAGPPQSCVRNANNAGIEMAHWVQRLNWRLFVFSWGLIPAYTGVFAAAAEASPAQPFLQENVPSEDLIWCWLACHQGTFQDLLPKQQHCCHHPDSLHPKIVHGIFDPLGGTSTACRSVNQ